MHPDHRQAQGKQTKAEAEGDDGGGHFAAAFLAFGLAGAVRARNSSAHSSALPAAKPPPVSSPGLSPSRIIRNHCSAGRRLSCSSVSTSTPRTLAIVPTKIGRESCREKGGQYV